MRKLGGGVQVLHYSSLHFTIMVNILIMDDNTQQPIDDPLKVLLKPEYYEKLKKQE